MKKAGFIDGLEKETRKRLLSALKWGNQVFVACARSHSSLVVSQAGDPAVPAIESGVARVGAPGAGLVLATDIRTGGRTVSSILLVGLVGCLAGQDGPLTCMLSQFCPPFLGLCPALHHEATH